MPYPSDSKASKVWKYFRCKRSVENSEQGHCVYCTKCSSQQIDGDTTKTKKIECTDQSRVRVIGLLKEHVANHDTVCAAHDKWTLCALCALLMINLLVSRPSKGKNGRSNPSIQTAACFGEEGRPFAILAWMGHAWFSVSAFTAAASVAAVPATEAICELLFKAGGQVLTSSRLRLLGERVESLLMCSYNSQRFGGIHGVEVVSAGKDGTVGGSVGAGGA